MEAGKLTSRELTLMYINRIALYDKQGPCINSVLEINPDALHIAEAMDVERQVKGPRGPLHGIPVLIKDNIDTFDKMHTSAGSIALADSYAPEDSYVAAALREVGAVILGKTNLTEFANFMSSNMKSGYSSRGGQVKNPYDPSFDVGGSSSGSGASVAANLTVVAVGTETSGSILNPSRQNSIVGIKPTVGLISRHGIIPISHSQDTAGPMSRTVTDAAILLGALTGVDERDPATLTSVGRFHKDYTPFLNAEGIKGKRIGYVTQGLWSEVSEEQTALFNQAIAVLRELGAIVEPVYNHLSFDEWQSEVLYYEFKSDLNAYLSRLGAGAPVRTLADIIAFNEAHADVALKYGQDVLIKSQEISGTLTEPTYINARTNDILSIQINGLDDLFDENQVDALLFPNDFGSPYPAKAGYPSVIVPAGYTTGGPFGITFTGKAYTEPLLISLAYAYEQATKLRVPPSLEENYVESI